MDINYKYNTSIELANKINETEREMQIQPDLFRLSKKLLLCDTNNYILNGWTKAYKRLYDSITPPNNFTALSYQQQIQRFYHSHDKHNSSSKPYSPRHLILQGYL